MKWLLRTQLALVFASLCVAAAAMTNSYFGMLTSAWSVAFPVLLVLGGITGLVALNRRKSLVPAGIVLLTPAALLLVSSISDAFGDAMGSRVMVAEFSSSRTDYDAKMREMDAALVWTNLVGGLQLAAAALAVVTAVLLFRRRRTTQADKVAG